MKWLIFNANNEINETNEMTGIDGVDKIDEIDDISDICQAPIESKQMSDVDIAIPYVRSVLATSLSTGKKHQIN